MRALKHVNSHNQVAAHVGGATRVAFVPNHHTSIIISLHRPACITSRIIPQPSVHHLPAQAALTQMPAAAAASTSLGKIFG
jgi:hypothetical protein